jgi:peptidylprolyl isomerase
MKRTLITLGLAALSIPALASEPDWRALNPENTLLIDTTEGRIVVEMRPDLAPNAVERVKTLAREHTYDQLLFHRVIDHFVDQTGDPNNKDGGVSSYPDLKPEFDTRIARSQMKVIAAPAGAVLGFLGSLPVEASAKVGSDGKARTWGLYCAGVAGMGRQAAEDSANSEIFFMRDPARRLDRDYTVWGQTVLGLDVVRRMKVGFPPKAPDKMLRVQVMADLPREKRPKILIMNEHGQAFATLLARSRAEKGADFSPCELQIQSKIAAK